MIGTLGIRSECRGNRPGTNGDNAQRQKCAAGREQHGEFLAKGSTDLKVNGRNAERNGRTCGRSRSAPMLSRRGNGIQRAVFQKPANSAGVSARARSHPLSRFVRNRRAQRCRRFRPPPLPQAFPARSEPLSPAAAGPGPAGSIRPLSIVPQLYAVGVRRSVRAELLDRLQRIPQDELLLKRLLDVSRAVRLLRPVRRPLQHLLEHSRPRVDPCRANPIAALIRVISSGSSISSPRRDSPDGPPISPRANAPC